jgi:hypothetical protein
LTVTFGEALKSPVTLTPSEADPLFTHAALTLDGLELGVGVFVAEEDPVQPASRIASEVAAATAASRTVERTAGTANSSKAWGCRVNPPARQLGAR